MSIGGMSDHKTNHISAFFHDNPEEILERAFQFFEGYPDVPALLLLMSDGDMIRSQMWFR